MKNRKSFRILLLILSVALIIGAAFGISAVAEENTPSVEIVAKNMSYGERFYIAFAVQGENLDAESEIGVRLYSEDPEANGEAVAIEAEKSEKTYNGNPIFYSYAYPAHKAAEYVWAVPYVKGSDVVGAAVRYSPLQYVKERLFEDAAGLTEAEKALYEEFIVFGEKAQAVIAPSDTPISSYKYISAEGGTVDGKYSAGTFPQNATVTLDYTGEKTVGYWKLTDAEGNVTAKNNGVAFTVESDCVAVPVFAVYDPTEGVATETFTYDDGAALPSTVTAQSLASTGASLAIKDGVLEFYTNNGAQDTVKFNRNAPNVANNRAYTFETDLYIADWKSAEEGATNGTDDQLTISFNNGSDYAHKIGLARVDSSVCINDYSTGSFKRSPAIAAAGEWFNLRIEWTYGSRSGDYNNSVMKIYINSELVFISAAGSVSGYVSARINVDNVRFTTNNGAEMVLKFDNVKLYSSDKTFDNTEIPLYVYDESNTIVANPNK